MKKLTSALAIALMSSSAFAFETPTMGWSSWNTFAVNISDSIIMRQADAMANSGLADAGYQYINIDDGFQGGRDEQTGYFLINPNRFPNGLKGVVDHIHALGLKAGIYSDAGANTCGNMFNNDTLSVNVGLMGHEKADADMFFNQLGFDFIKVDYCGANTYGNKNRYWFETEDRYRKVAEGIKSTGRDDIRFNVCRWAYPGTWIDDVATSWRVTGDIYCDWKSVKSIIDECLYLAPFARNGHYNDMDMLEIGRTMSQIEDETHMAMWCMMASPLLIGCDMTTLRPESFALLTNKELIALNQDPLGKQAYVLHADKNGGYIFVKDIKELNGTERAVAFYNPTDGKITLKTTLEQLGLEGPATARDAVNQKALPDVKDKISVTLQPHQTAVYTLNAKGRLVQKVYEAENAFLSAYQELYNPNFVGTAYHIRDPRLRNGAGVVNAGVTAKNDIVWEEVIVPEDGDYDITINYLPKDTNEFFISVNGSDGTAIAPAKEGDKVVSATVKMPLHKGINKVRLYSTDVIPVIDFMEIN